MISFFLNVILDITKFTAAKTYQGIRYVLYGHEPTREEKIELMLLEYKEDVKILREELKDLKENKNI